MELNQLFKSLSDESRIRLVLLLEQQELTVAELSEITQLAQPRVSTHLSQLRKLDLVICRKQGVSAFYRLNHETFNNNYTNFIEMLQSHYVKHPLIIEDKHRLKLVLTQQAKSNNWFDSVAGDMERHYSPGRTWEATTRSLSCLLNLGNVLDIGSGDGVLAELLAERSASYTCVDSSKKLIEAAQRRLKDKENISYVVADMHQLNADPQYDCVLMLHVLTYAKDPQLAIEQAYKACSSGGKLLISTLHEHQHQEAIDVYGHLNFGFKTETLKDYCQKAGFDHIKADVTSQEQRKPYFKIVTLEAYKS
ncbi:ArsR/SmtB family transcription factor [Marinicella sp. W31]|uniref:ArsR/SmtB family transcription factor n=1 Tax=Marinicella sp. W31 TaxID=3023713 RepID=UPI0037577BF1